MGKFRQQDKALKSKDKIWYICIRIKEHLKTEWETHKEGNFVCVYVVDNSMARAIKKAVHYYGRITGIKSINLKEFYKRDSLRISIRRACRIEIVNARAGGELTNEHGRKVLEVI